MHIPSTLIYFLLGVVVSSVVWVAGLTALVALVNRAKVRREREPEDVGRVIYVDGQLGSDANDGHAPEVALATVAAAVSIATPHDQIVISPPPPRTWRGTLSPQTEEK